MKASTIIRHRRAIGRALAAAEGAPTGLPSLETLARAAAMAPHHFAHVYKDYVGEPVFRTLGSARIERACAADGLGRGTVGAVARTVGYASGQAFARAHRRHAGMTPTARRRSPVSEDSSLTVVWRDAHRLHGVPYRGDVAGAAAFYEHCVGSAYAAAGRERIASYRRKLDMFGMNEDAGMLFSSRVEHMVCLAAGNNPAPDTAWREIGTQAGWYAAVSVRGLAARPFDVADIASRLTQEFAAGLSDGPVFVEWVTDPALVLPSQAVRRFFLPLAMQ